MKTVDIKKIRKKMEKEQDSKRFEHTLGVAYTASALAMCNQTDPEKALIAFSLYFCQFIFIFSAALALSIFSFS